MAVKRDELFREVTLRMSSSLQIKTALGRVLDYVREHLPVDELFLEVLDTNLSAVRRIAYAVAGNGEAPEEIVPLPAGLWEWVLQWKAPFIVSASEQDEHIKAMRPLVKLEGNTDVVVPLRLEGKPMGLLVLRARREGAFTLEHLDLLEAAAEPFSIALANALAHEKVLRHGDILIDDNRFLKEELHSRAEEEIIGANSGLSNVMEMVRQVSPLSNTVLLLGETGTGKEMIANAIHFGSFRREGPFIKVNCGAIPESLIDSELFGYEKGAFTGASTSKRGRFERADGGTIFLDEIAELPLQAQIRLLRVLQNREIERVGGTRAIRVDIRVIAATHRNLESMVSENRFREDLWFRLNVFPIIVPPLRHRKEDIPALTRHFVARKSKELGIAMPAAIAPGALDRLMHYGWRGNVRELENLVERELIRHGRQRQLTFGSLLPDPAGGEDSAGREAASIPSPLKLDEAMALHIQKVLKMTKGKIHGPGGAAELLGINANTLRGRMSRLAIEYGRRKRG